MIRNAIFDLDGTLLDTREGIIESVKFAITYTLSDKLSLVITTHALLP